MARTKRLVMVAVIAALVVLAGCSGGTGGDAPPANRGGGGSGAGGSGGGDSSGAGGGTGGGGGNADAAAGGASYYVDGERVVVRESEMTVRVGEFDPAFTEVRAVVEGYGGYVQDYSIDVERGWHTATMRLKVPAGSFLDARAELAGLGTVEAESVDAKDFSDEYNNREEHLAELRSEKAELQRILSNTDDGDKARRLRDELSGLRAEIERLEEQQSALDRRSTLSTIQLTIHEPVTDKPPQNYRTAYGFDDAFLEAFYGGLVILKTTVVMLGYLASVGIAVLMFAVLAVIAYRAGRLFLRLSGLSLPGGGGGSGGTGGAGGGDGPGRLGGQGDPSSPNAPEGATDAD